MKWRVANTDGARWLEHDGKGWAADGQTTEEVNDAKGKPVPVASLAETYRPKGDGDQTWLYQAARSVIPGPVKVTGTPPKVPAATGDYPEGAVF